MPMQEPLASHEKIILEATRLFVNFGYNGMAMRVLAEATGISKAGLYYHFKDKEELFLAVLKDYLDQIAGIIRHCREAGGSARVQISQIMRDIFASAPEQRSIIRLASQEITNLSPKSRASFGVIYQEKFIGQLTSIFSAGIEAHEFRPMDAQIMTWVLLGMMYPYFYPSHSRVLSSSDDIIDTMLVIFFEGITL